jgi:hypothetical protein
MSLTEIQLENAERVCSELCDALMVIEVCARADAIRTVATMVLDYCGYEMARLGTSHVATRLFIASSDLRIAFGSIVPTVTVAFANRDRTLATLTDPSGVAAESIPDKGSFAFAARLPAIPQGDS